MLKNVAMASLFSVALPATLFAQSTIVTINPGDTVNVTATLTTTDPNENGEGEPIVVQANDGLSTTTVGVDFNYGIPQTFTYTAPPVLINPGSPIPTTAITYYIQGADGDESASFSTAVNPNPSPLTPAQKAKDANVAAILGYVAAGTAAVGPACALLTAGAIPCAIGVGFTGAAAAAAGTYYARLAADPPDPNFMVIATPATVTLPSDITVGAALATDDLKAVALGAALLTSINRYQGAVAAGNAFWAAQQLAAVNNYLSQLNAITGNLSADIQALVNQLQALGISGNITPAEILTFEQNLAAEGLTGEIVPILQDLGLTATDIQDVTQDLYVQDINTIAGNYPSQLDAFASQLPAASVPEPGTLCLIGISLTFLFGVRFYRQAL